MVKANIYFRVINNETIQILEALRTARLSVKIWIPAAGIDYITRLRIRDISIINYGNVHNMPECYRWDIGLKKVYQENDGLDYLLARIIDYNTGFICVDSIKHSCGQIVLFQDSIRHHEYPYRFHRIRVFDSYLTLKTYLDSIPDIFSLNENPKFFKTPNIVQGANVYMELSTGRYWYKDKLHTDHYEVFSSEGTHLGEANLNGELDESKNDKRKRVNF